MLAAIVAVILIASYFSQSQGLWIFVKNEKTAPLFDFPETSFEDLASFASELAAIEKEFYPFYGKESAAKLYPDALWQMIAEVSVKRRIFYEDPTWFNAWKLSSAQTRAAKVYEEDIESFVDLWEEFRQENSAISPQFSFLFLPSVASDIALFENGLKEIQQNAVELKKITAGQKRCLFLPWIGCLRLATRLEPIVRASISDAPSLPQVHLETAREVLQARQISPRRFSVATPCFGGNSANFLLWERLIGNQYIFTPKLISNSFFRDLAIPGTSDAAARSAGFPYAWQPEMNWYLCPDLGYVTELATLARLFELARDAPIGELNTSLEIALWRSQSGNFSLISPRIRFEAEEYIKAGPSQSPEGKVSALVTRGYPSFLFLTWNRSVWFKEPLVLTRRETRFESPLHSYRELAGKISPDEMRQIMEISVAKIP